MSSSATTSVSARTLRCWSWMTFLPIRTSTPPVRPAALPPASPPCSAVTCASPPAERLVTGARNSRTGSPFSLTVSRCSTAAAGAAGISRGASPFWASTTPLASRMRMPTTSERSVVPDSCPASIALSMKLSSETLSSVRTAKCVFAPRFSAM